jgi:hypothetical protein
VTLQKYFSCKNIFHIQALVIYFVSNLTHETETGTADRWGITNNKPPEPITMIGQSETLSSSQIIFITLFSGGAQCCSACYQPPQTLQLCGAQNHFTGPFKSVLVGY